MRDQAEGVTSSKGRPPAVPRRIGRHTELHLELYHAFRELTDLARRSVRRRREGDGRS